MPGFDEIKLVVYRYWPQKISFMLDCDVSEYWTMFAVESGAFKYEIGDARGEAKGGDLVICPPGLQFHRSTIEPLTFHFIQFIWKTMPTNEYSGKVTIADQGRLASTYRYMRNAGLDEIFDEQRSSDIQHYLHDIWLLMKRDRENVNEQDGPEGDSLMESARSWLSNRAYEPFMMRELSDRLCMSPVQLTRKFRAAYNMTPSSYVTGLRLAHACKLLEETTLTLEAIALRCGYENGFYLSRVFHARKGITASAYRKLHQL